MRFVYSLLLSLCIFNCNQEKNKVHPHILQTGDSTTRSYKEIKDSIVAQRKHFSRHYSSTDTSIQNQVLETIRDYWVNAISNDLYSKWQNTPWDFNGTTTQPQHGTIACGYFVTTILQDMDLKINRIKLSVCASSEMMKSLAPNQRLKKLNHLSYDTFNNTLTEYGKGVYIIGLDFHTGFIINDGKENWFIHSNYINRLGVIKEAVLSSPALKASKTRWMISLTGDKELLQKWLNG